MSEAADRSESLLTLEPLLEAVREGVEGRNWDLSGLQKTTSHEFEGRWAGESTRSAYLFFHRESAPEWVSVEGFLDETSRGLRANLSLVVEGPDLGDVEDVERALETLASLARRHLPEGYERPISVRFRLAGVGIDAGAAESQLRFKLHLPKSAIDAGAGAVSALAGAAADAFEAVFRDPLLRPFTPEG